MKKTIFVLLLFCYFANLHSNNKSIRLVFTANNLCENYPLDSITVNNISRGETKTLLYPDTVLYLEPISSTGILEGNKHGIKLSQNFPNPFTEKTKFNLTSPENTNATIRIFDLLGKKIISKKMYLNEGIHNFTFYADNNNIYILNVSTDFGDFQKVMIQHSGQNRNPALYYNGIVHDKYNKFNKFNKTKGFEFYKNDTLEFIGHITDNNVYSDTVRFVPYYDALVEFYINSDRPSLPNIATGKEVVHEYEEGLVYETEKIKGAIYNWNVPDDWEIISGQGTNSIVVNAGKSEGSISVRAQNNCGLSNFNWTRVRVVHNDSFAFVYETKQYPFRIRLKVRDAEDLMIDWGDGTVDTINGTKIVDHFYNGRYEWTVNVSGKAALFGFNAYRLLNDYAKNLKDILSPVSYGIEGIKYADSMFGNVKVESFTCKNFFDEASANVVSMSYMFELSSFNQDISNWDVSNVENMSYMFHFSDFNQEIGNWDVSKVEDMTHMFKGSPFNQNIGKWNVENVNSMIRMFSYSPFNQDISNWNIGNVEAMQYMFSKTPFNQNIGDWDISNAINMSGMFYFSPFNQNISKWDVRNVMYMESMFLETPFNHDISDWDVSNVENMRAMFAYSDFDQDISGWNIENIENIEYFLYVAEMSTENYNKLLIEWSKRNLQENIIFNGGASKYDLGYPEERRQFIIDEFGWTIEDGGSSGQYFEKF